MDLTAQSETKPSRGDESQHSVVEGDHELGIGWHFADLVADATRAMFNHWHVAKNIADAVPLIKQGLRFAPGVGILGETLHVTDPWARAHADHEARLLSEFEFNALKVAYIAYAATGALGLPAVFAKEGMVHILKIQDVEILGYTIDIPNIDSRYLPHTLIGETKEIFTGEELKDYHLSFLSGDNVPASGGHAPYKNFKPVSWPFNDSLDALPQIPQVVAKEKSSLTPIR